MTFIDNNQVESNLWKVDPFTCDHAVACDEDTTLLFEDFDLLLSIRAFFIVKLHDVIDILAPFAQLSLPIDFHRRRHHNQDLSYLLSVE